MRRQSLFGPGQTVVHDGRCKHCGAVSLLPIAQAVLVKSRFVWLCPSCLDTNAQRLSRRHARKLKDIFHRPGGTRISPEELQKFRAKLARLDDAVVKELR